MIRPAVLLLLASLGFPAQAAEAPKPARQPNILMILADDLGYGDTGIYGSTRIKTPSIDRLARSGIRFTAGYVSHPVCAPSRAGMLTGRVQNRFGFEFNPVGRDMASGMARTEQTIGQLMKAQGYRTGVIGKWHIGGAPGFRPTERGFDEFFGITAGAAAYFNRMEPGDEALPSLFEETLSKIQSAENQAKMATLPMNDQLKMIRAQYPVFRGTEPVEENAYLTEAFTREAISFMDRAGDQPFFLHLAYTAPHTPLHATAKYLARYAHIKDPATRVYSAMVSALDDGIGQLLDHLEKTGKAKDTIVILLSDNGCAAYIGKDACSNQPLAGAKTTYLEGGIRVPFLIAWPGQIAPRVEDRMVSALDILPTALAAAGASPPEGLVLDGINLLPVLRDAKTRMPDRALFWRAGVNYAVRQGPWKFIIANIARPREPQEGRASRWVPDGIQATISPLGQHPMLYDLSADLGESNNLAASKPELVEEIKARIKTWDKGMSPPQWTSQRQSVWQHDGKSLEVFN